MKVYLKHQMKDQDFKYVLKFNLKFILSSILRRKIISEHMSSNIASDAL